MKPFNEIFHFCIGHKEIARILIDEKTVDINAMDTCIKYTPLHWAAEKCKCLCDDN